MSDRKPLFVKVGFSFQVLNNHNTVHYMHFDADLRMLLSYFTRPRGCWPLEALLERFPGVECFTIHRYMIEVTMANLFSYSQVQEMIIDHFNALERTTDSMPWSDGSLYQDVYISRRSL